MVAVVRSAAFMLGIVVLLVACSGTCPASTCPTSFDVVQTCTSQQTCSIDGQIVTQCISDKTSYEAPSGCGLASLASSATFDIDVSMLWKNFGTRNDLQIDFGQADAIPDPQSIFPGQILFDGAPAQCTCGAYGCECDDVATSTQMISIFNSSGASIENLRVAFIDARCSPPPCEK